jgi:hypothetical protein
MVAAARLVPAAGDTPAPTPDVPRDVCTHAIGDPAGDAKPVSAGVSGTALTDNNPGLDVEAINARVTATQLQVFLGVNHFDAPAKMANYETAWRYTVTLKANGKLITFGAEMNNPALPSTLYPADGALYDHGYIFVSTNGDLAGATVSFAPGTGSHLSWIVYTAPRDKVEKAISQPLSPGTPLTNVTASTQDYTVEHTLPGGDSLPSTLTAAQDQLTVGDEWCFGPPPTALSTVTVPAATYGHPATVSAVLKDENGKALAGKPVTFTVQDPRGTTVTGTTDANGLATATFPAVTVPAGSYPLVAQFAGEGTTLKTSSATGTLVVAAQKTAFSALKIAKSGAARTVAATLLDDLKKPVASVKVDWYVNGKKTTTTTTDKTGKTVLGGVKPGQKVQARFAGKPGYWLASVSATVKAS